MEALEERIRRLEVLIAHLGDRLVALERRERPRPPMSPTASLAFQVGADAARKLALGHE